MKKTLEQLNDKELVELTQEEIDYYIKLKKAEAGIRILVCPDEPVLQEIPEPDCEMYRVSQWVYKEKEKAEEVAAAINKNIASSFTADYDYYRSGGDYKYAKPFTGSIESVEIIRLYSLPVYNSIKDVIASNKRVKDAYNTVKSDYDGENERASEIVDEIYDLITKARERLDKFRNFRSVIVDYLQLANGDRDIAWGFFDKAYAVEPSVKSMIMESEEYKKAIDSYING